MDKIFKIIKDSAYGSCLPQKVVAGSCSSNLVCNANGGLTCVGGSGTTVVGSCSVNYS